jgi:hypothetical protein
VAHLDGDTSNSGEDNLAVLDRRCHRAHDYASWAAKFKEYLRIERERRADEKDAARPILQMLVASSPSDSAASATVWTEASTPCSVTPQVVNESIGFTGGK